MKAADWYGLRARAVQVEEVENLRYLEKGAILHWQFQHFVVFEGLKPGGADIVDPAAGRRRVSNAWWSRGPTSS